MPHGSSGRGLGMCGTPRATAWTLASALRETSRSCGLEAEGSRDATSVKRLTLPPAVLRGEGAQEPTREAGSGAGGG